MRISTAITLAVLCSACARGARVPRIGAPSPALRSALADTDATTRVYLPQDVATQASAERPSPFTQWSPGAFGTMTQSTTFEDPRGLQEYEGSRRGSVSSLPYRSPPTVHRRLGAATMRFVLDADGRIQWPTLEVRAASDDKAAKTARAELAKWRWRPAALTDGRTVSQLVEVDIRIQRYGFTPSFSSALERR